MWTCQDVSQKTEVVSQKNEVVSLKKEEVSLRKDEPLPKEKDIAKKNVEQFVLLDCNTKKSSVESEVKKDEDGEKVDPTKYTRVAGCLKYLTYTRPDLSFSVGIASCFIEKPTTLHFQVVKHILRYVKGTIDYRLNYGKCRKVEDMVEFSDNDFGGDKTGDKHTSEISFYLKETNITWQSQRTVTLSILDFMTANAMECQVVWLVNLLVKVTRYKGPVNPFVVNKSTIALWMNSLTRERIKCSHTRIHTIWEYMDEGQVTAKLLKEIKMDIFTIALMYEEHGEMQDMIGMTNLEPSLV